MGKLKVHWLMALPTDDPEIPKYTQCGLEIRKDNRSLSKRVKPLLTTRNQHEVTCSRCNR